MARGSVRPYVAKDKTTRYRVRVDCGINPATGRRKQIQGTCRTRRQADIKLRQWLTEIESGTFQVPQPQTLAELCALWLETRIAIGHKTTTYDKYEMIVRVHLVPALGAIPVQKLTTLHVEQFYARKLAAGGSDDLLRTCKVRLAQALDLAIKHRLILINPARLAALPPRRPTAPTTKARSWTREQAITFLAVAREDSRYGPLWVLMIQTGLRLAEALGLRWSDVNLDDRRIRVEQQVLRPRKGGGQSPLDSPKTPNAHRSLRIPPSLVTLLRAHRLAQTQRRLKANEPWLDANLVFTRADGRRIPSYLPRYDLDALVAQAGVPRLSSHGLRRTFITLSLRQGVPLATVSRLVGHSKVSITQDLYQDVTRDVQDEGWDIIAGVLDDRQEGAK